MATQVTTSDNGMPPLPERMWHNFLGNMQWRDKLHKRAAYKSLDIIEDPMIEANRQVINRGFGWPEMLVLAAAGLGAAYMFKPEAKEPAPVQVVSQPDFVDKDSVSDVRFPE